MNRLLMWLSCNRYASPYMQWYWRKLLPPPVDIQPMLDNLRRHGVVR